ncbi:signal peptidase II [Methylocaldum szegediense]|jgi:signal peptidase II|uniref:Lipoprotein signal peptidase n=1 Tax=Methylocaldum szegediense TaxID=73780 RepID=A0ABN8X712_9GAMM|nr:signal peptidase II [Methylocaldum szegediense]CAI8873768.1 lipoprotein signal peptidase [Methylocaldum szegediense]
MLHWLWLSVLVVVLDQLTKLMVDRSMELYESVGLLPFFQLTYLRNQGAAFSFLSEAGGWQRWFFIGLAAIASVAICYWLSRLGKNQRWEAAAWALVLGGALGNLIDRVAYGYVIDFIDVFYGEWHWPAFNVADSAITIGVVMLLIDSLRPRQSTADLA